MMRITTVTSTSVNPASRLLSSGRALRGPSRTTFAGAQFMVSVSDLGTLGVSGAFSPSH